jgi:hypothetical protein
MRLLNDPNMKFYQIHEEGTWSQDIDKYADRQKKLLSDHFLLNDTINALNVSPNFNHCLLFRSKILKCKLCEIE